MAGICPALLSDDTADPFCHFVLNIPEGFQVLDHLVVIEGNGGTLPEPEDAHEHADGVPAVLCFEGRVFSHPWFFGVILILGLFVGVLSARSMLPASVLELVVLGPRQMILPGTSALSRARHLEGLVGLFAVDQSVDPRGSSCLCGLCILVRSAGLVAVRSSLGLINSNNMLTIAYKD